MLRTSLLKTTYICMNRIYSLLLVWFVTFGLWAQVSFQAQAPNKIDINGQLRVQFVLSGAEGSDFRAPALNDFDVLAGPNVSSYSSVNISMRGAQTSSSTTYTYILSPKRNGALHIGAASVHAKGKVYQTRPLTVQVSGKANANVANNTPSTTQSADIQRVGSRIAPHDLYFTTELSKRTLYEQEPLMLSYRYHVRQGVAVANITAAGKPELKGFWTQEIEMSNKLVPEGKNIGGKMYLVGTNQQYMIFPQQSGKLTIPSLTFRSNVVQRNDAIDEIDAFFNGGSNVSLTIDRDAPAVSVEVLPLPKPQPANFSGGVGQLSIQSRLVTSVPKTNDVATLRVVVSGSGNLKLVKAPVVSFPRDFDTYTPKTNDKVKVTRDGIEGSMEFDYTFVPRNVGTYTIPVIELVYFDPQTKTYVTKRTSPITLKVEKGNKPYAPIAAAENNDIRGLHTKETSSLSENSPFFIGSASYWLVLLGCGLGVGVIFQYLLPILAGTGSNAARRTRRADKKVRERLQRAEHLLIEHADSRFYDALSEAIMGYFAEKLQLDQTSITQQVVLEQLSSRGVSPELLSEVESVLSEIDFGRFAPSTDAVMKGLYERAVELIQRLNTTL